MNNVNVEYNYSGAKVLVTGGSNGIGYGIASAFAAAGAQVTITGTRSSADEYDNDLSAFTYKPLQLTDRDAIRALADSLDGLDILINNAGASLPGGQDEWQPEVFEESVRINLISTYDLANACKELLTASDLPGGASIIGIASLTSFFANEMVPGYGAAKAGVVQLSKTLGISWAKHGIRANAIAAGMIDTRMTSFMKDIPDMNDPIMARTPMKRWGTPEDIANAALFLASSGASFITGQTLLVDGGYSVFG
ncbi:MAG: SDR family oxidoreductase [Proteobacteria bacterium]|nr:SDR family oxidoreductase [Pseudomonadota bacterium]